MKAISEADYDRNLHTLAKRAFAEHELVRCDHENPAEARRWEIAKREGTRWAPFYYTEIVCLAGGRLFVHGDISPVLYSAADTSKGRSVPAWIAEADFDYTVRKAECGHMSKTHTLDPEVALHEFRQSIAQLREGHRDDAGRFAKPPAHKQAKIDRITRGMALLRDGEPVDDVFRFLYDAGEDPENFSHIGRVADPRCHYAYAALRRLCELVPKVPT